METTVVVEKIRTITDLDSLKSGWNYLKETITELALAQQLDYSVNGNRC